MAFATLAEFKEFLRSTEAQEQISAQVGTAGVDDDVLTRWIDEGGAWLKQKLAARYAVTEAAVAADATLTIWFREANCLRSAWYGIGTHMKLAIPKGLQTAFNELVATIAAIVAGDQALPGDTPLPSSPTATSYAEAAGDPRVLTMDSMEGLP